MSATPQGLQHVIRESNTPTGFCSGSGMQWEAATRDVHSYMKGKQQTNWVLLWIRHAVNNNTTGLAASNIRERNTPTGFCSGSGTQWKAATQEDQRLPCIHQRSKSTSTTRQPALCMCLAMCSPLVILAPAVNTLQLDFEVTALVCNAA